jgi:hypothetical protein
MDNLIQSFQIDVQISKAELSSVCCTHDRKERLSYGRYLRH